MRVFLVIDRSKTAPGIWALLWTAGDDDPRLLESKHFLGEAALQVWLAGIWAEKDLLLMNLGA